VSEIASFRALSLRIGRVPPFGPAGQRAASPGKPIFMAGASARWPRAIIALAGSLSLEIVAEGIEKLSEKAVLESLGLHRRTGLSIRQAVVCSRCFGLDRDASAET
jgi:hypothetical protein